MTSSNELGAPSATAVRTSPDAARQNEAEDVRHLLADHVPLSLIMDLATSKGPDSKAILDSEGEPETTWWLKP